MHAHASTDFLQTLVEVGGITLVTLSTHHYPVSQSNGIQQRLSTHLPRPVGIVLVVRVLPSNHTRQTILCVLWILIILIIILILLATFSVPNLWVVTTAGRPPQRLPTSRNFYSPDVAVCTKSHVFANKITFVRTWSLSYAITFSIQPTWRPLYEVMWRHRLHDQSIRHRQIPTGGPLELILNLLTF